MAKIASDYDPGLGVDDSQDNMRSAAYWWWRAYVVHFGHDEEFHRTTAETFADWYSARWQAFHEGTGRRPGHLDREGFNYHFFASRHGGTVPDELVDTNAGQRQWRMPKWSRVARATISKRTGTENAFILALVKSVNWSYRIYLIPGGPHGDEVLTYRESGDRVEKLDFSDNPYGSHDLGVALEHIREAVRKA